MSKVKLSVRLATFLATFTLALVIVTLLARPLISNVDVAPVADLALTPPKPVLVSDRASNFVDYKTQLVSLDLVRGTAYATLTLKRRFIDPTPTKFGFKPSSSRPTTPRERFGQARPSRFVSLLRLKIQRL